MNQPQDKSHGIIYRFHPAVRIFMLFIASLTGIYTAYFMFIMIPTAPTGSIFFKILSVVILYVSGTTVYTHLTALNAVVIRADSLEFRYLLKRNILIPWNRLQKIEIFKVITHYWRTTYTDDKGATKTYKTSLAFPSVMQILMNIQDHCPELEMNELLKQVLIYKRTVADARKSEPDTTPLESEK
jgi:hypothetical protein